MSNCFGLIFDVDGVIGNTEPINARATAQVMQKMFGIEKMQAGDFEAGLGRGAKEYIRAGAVSHNLELSDQQLDKAVVKREKAIIDLVRTQGLTSFPGVIELMQAAVNDDNFKLAIASSADMELVKAILDSVNAPESGIDEMITGDQISQKKPDPEVFLKAIQALDIPADKCAVIEDAPDGVKAAKNAKTACIAVTNSVSADKLKEADLVIDSLDKINLQDIKLLINQQNKGFSN